MSTILVIGRPASLEAVSPESYAPTVTPSAVSLAIRLG